MRSLIENRISALLEGQDQVYYHGTRALFPFNEFTPRLIGTGTSSSGQKFGGFFFTSEQENAEFYAEDFVAKIKIKDIKPAPEGETHSPTVLRMAIESSQNLKLEDVLDGSMYSDIVVVPTSNVDDIEIIEWIFVGDKEFYFDQLDKLFFNLDDYDPEDEDNIDDDGNVMPPYIDTYQIDSLLGQMELNVKSMMSVPIFNEYYNTVEERLSKEYGLMQEIINNRISTLFENPQKADKEFFNSKEYLTPADKEIVLSITGGDIFTYKIAELLDQFLAYEREQNPDSDASIYKPSLQDFYNGLKSYNASVFPLKGFLVDQPSKDAYEVAEFMKHRAAAVDKLKQLPKIVVRNLRHITQPEREYNYQIKEFNQGLKSIVSMLQHISDTLDEEGYSRVIKKAFHSKDLYYNFEHYFEKLQGLLDIETFDTRNIDKEEVKQDAVNIGAEILQEGEDFLLMAVTEAHQLREISCNVHWCVTGEGYFDTHTTVIPEMYILLQLDSRINNEDRLLLYTESDGMDYEDTSIVREYGMPEMEWYNAHNENTYPMAEIDDEELKQRVKELTKEYAQDYFDRFEEEEEEEELSMVAEFVRMAVGEYIKGGEADSKSVEDIAQKHDVPVFFIKHELSIGSKIEIEHVDDNVLAREIAMDHLWEFPDYYTRLEKMEKDADLDEANPLIAVDDIPKGHDARVVDEEWDYDEDQMNYTTTSVSGEFYHGTSIDEGEVYRELDPNYSDWEAIWFANDENISQEFGENRTNDGDTQVVYTVEINSDKIVYLGQQDFEDIKEHYHLEDLREAIPILRQAGFDGWQTLGSIGWNQYDDFAIWNMDVVTIKSIMLMDAEGEWSEKMSLDQAQEIVSSKEGIDEANPIIPIDDIPKGHFARNVGIVSW
jgi:hypothetical protein